VLALITGLFSVWACDNNQLVNTIPGSGWNLIADSINTMTDTTYQRARNIGDNASLYTGVSQPDGREALLLFGFSTLDSLILANFDSAKIRIFHRTFNASPELLDSVFTLERIIAGAGEEPWVESDTGLVPENFGNSDSVASAIMTNDTVDVLQSGLVVVRQRVEHLTFDISKDLLQAWYNESPPNHGLLLRVPEGIGLVSFYSSESIRPPYLVVTYQDTSTDISRTNYFLPAHDVSVYPALTGSAPADRLVLNRSDNHRVHINFKKQIDSLESRPVASARLILTVDADETHMMSSTMELEVHLRTQPIADGDSGMVEYDAIVFTAIDNRLEYHLGPLLMQYLSKWRNNFGFDLVVSDSQNDFDRLTLWGLTAPDRPRLEIVYAIPPGTTE
ncbi:MAG: hypothetical protein V3W14_08430, partial [Candidatus Neomarinimicrobiota bacterium]